MFVSEALESENERAKHKRENPFIISSHLGKQVSPFAFRKIEFLDIFSEKEVWTGGTQLS